MIVQEYFIGLLSGTSIDGVDCVLVDFSHPLPKLVATHNEPISTELRSKILTLCSSPLVSLITVGETDVELGKVFANAVNSLLHSNNIPAKNVLAIGSHGQTIKHHPVGASRFTTQIGDPNTISYLTGITTIADFRRKDMAAGGQGAPLAPLFHQSIFGKTESQRAVLNIGGIANISLLMNRQNHSLIGFDTGPGNVLMDSWINLKKGLSYDDKGLWAHSGKPNMNLLATLMAEPYLKLASPKSTGRELFSLAWLEKKLAEISYKLPDEDIQATLLEFTVRSIAESVDWAHYGIDELVICGGGAYNDLLMARLSTYLEPIKVVSSSKLGLAPEWIEGVAFAWLARKTWSGEAIDTSSVTGASTNCILGGIYSA
jgi:anhydro-N-acetylmuramic acid kinase